MTNLVAGTAFLAASAATAQEPPEILADQTPVSAADACLIDKFNSEYIEKYTMENGAALAGGVLVNPEKVDQMVDACEADTGSEVEQYTHDYLKEHPYTQNGVTLTFR